MNCKTISIFCTKNVKKKEEFNLEILTRKTKIYINYFNDNSCRNNSILLY